MDSQERVRPRDEGYALITAHNAAVAAARGNEGLTALRPQGRAIPSPSRFVTVPGVHMFRFVFALDYNAAWEVLAPNRSMENRRCNLPEMVDNA